MNFASTLLVNLKDKLDKISDQSVRNDIETEIRKADLDLLDKINQISQQLSTIQALVPSTGGLAPLPQTAAGVGQWKAIFSSGDGAAVALPANGTWAYFIIRASSATGGVTANASLAGVAAGGTTVGAATAGQQWTGFCWRVT